MFPIDEIEELRSELRHCRLTPAERRDAESKLTELLQRRNKEANAELRGSDGTGRNGSTRT